MIEQLDDLKNAPLQVTQAARLRWEIGTIRLAFEANDPIALLDRVRGLSVWIAPLLDDHAKTVLFCALAQAACQQNDIDAIRHAAERLPYQARTPKLVWRLCESWWDEPTAAFPALAFVSAANERYPQDGFGDYLQAGFLRRCQALPDAVERAFELQSEPLLLLYSRAARKFEACNDDAHANDAELCALELDFADGQPSIESRTLGRLRLVESSYDEGLRLAEAMVPSDLWLDRVRVLDFFEDLWPSLETTRPDTTRVSVEKVREGLRVCVTRMAHPLRDDELERWDDLIGHAFDDAAAAALRQELRKGSGVADPRVERAEKAINVLDQPAEFAAELDLILDDLQTHSREPGLAHYKAIWSRVAKTGSPLDKSLTRAITSWAARTPASGGLYILAAQLHRHKLPEAAGAVAQRAFLESESAPDDVLDFVRARNLNYLVKHGSDKRVRSALEEMENRA